MRSWILVVLLAAAVVAAIAAWTSGDDATPSPEERAAKEDRATPDAPAPEGAPAGETDGGRAAEDGACRGRKSEGEKEIKIGGFERPENTPAYEVLENERDTRDCARGTHLLVDTRADDEADFALIARDIKARYAGLDAVSVEFTDATGVLDYEGAALIFNTPAGADYMGFVYGPPNNKGYFVQAAN